MRRAIFLLTAVLLLASGLSAQIGKNIIIAAGSEEDRALKVITDTADPAQKLVLLDKFMADFGKGDTVLAAYEIYISIYGAQKNYDKAFEFGDKTFAVDPDSLSTAISLFPLAQEKNDVERMFTYGERAEQIVARFKARPAPEGMSAKEWESRQAAALSDYKDQVRYVQVNLFRVANQPTDPKHKAELLDRYATNFTDAPEAASAQSLTANAYRQAQNYLKMQEFAQKILARDPDNLNMLVLLADDGSDRGVNLDKAEQYAHHAIDLLEKGPKPEGLSDAEWAQQKSVQQGIAWSSIGQVQLRRNQNSLAVESLKTASPLLKSDNFSYARNQYRLGFAYLNLKEMGEARAAFAEAASVNTPFRGPAQEKLASIPASGAAKQPAKKRP